MKLKLSISHDGSQWSGALVAPNGSLLGTDYSSDPHVIAKRLTKHGLEYLRLANRKGMVVLSKHSEWQGSEAQP